MKRISVLCIFTLLAAFLCAQPFYGTIFDSPDVITSQSPSAFIRASYTGRGNVTMFDRRTNNWEQNNAFLFLVEWDDGLTSVAQINSEFGTVEAAAIEAQKYGFVIGQLPRCLRVDVDAIWVHKGTELFGGGNRSILIHTGQTALYEADGILEEVLVHEASHTSLDEYHYANPLWTAARDADNAFISTYAQDHPLREDIAESFLPWLAVTFAKDRVSQEYYTKVTQTIPHRLQYFSNQNFDLYPFVQHEVIDCNGDKNGLAYIDECGVCVGGASGVTPCNKTQLQTWENPHILNNEYPLYGIGDPYILKYNGLFYLYSSTRDTETGVKVWSSTNLVDWNYEGLCATDASLKAAYAPEVIYWGGKFYMYSSPAGNGHYIYESNSPTGPFERKTGNLGQTIDGSVFIDDDGSLTFYRAGFDGIVSHTMDNPLHIGAGTLLPETRMANTWTEGPFTFKRNGEYYMIYTGNHVLNPSYRIDIAKSNNPKVGFVPYRNMNPVILNTEGDFYGLGHGSVFVGPNLDAYYVTYHNKAGDFGVGPYRQLNFDKIGFNGNVPIVMGATNSPQIVPEMPTYFQHFFQSSLPHQFEYSTNAHWTAGNQRLHPSPILENQRYSAICTQDVAENYTVELNVRITDNNAHAIMGGMFNYADENNYGIVLIHTQSKQLEVRFMMHGTWEEPTMFPLHGVDGFTNFHAIRVEKFGNTFKFFVNNMLKHTTQRDLQKGRVGLMCYGTHVEFGFFAYSHHARTSSVHTAFKPIPGRIHAVHYTHAQCDNASGQNSYRLDNATIVPHGDGSYNVVGKKTDTYSYSCMVQSTQNHAMLLRYKSATQGAAIRIWHNGENISGDILLPTTTNATREITIDNLLLESGATTFIVEIIEGEIELCAMEFYRTTPIHTAVTDDFNAAHFSNAWNYSDGDWYVQSGNAVCNGTGKRTMGNVQYANYIVKTDVFYTDNMNGGLIFRVQNPASGGVGNNAHEGADFYQGYFFTLNPNGCTLGKQNYNWTELATAPGSFSLNTWYRIAIRVKGANIKVYVNNMDVPIIDYTDSYPFVVGKAGLRSFLSHVRFDNFSIEPIEMETYNGTGLTTLYYSDDNLKNMVHTDISPTINFDWGNGAPHSSMPIDNFSIRWIGQLQAPETGVYQFHITSDNGRRLWVNNTLIIDKWINDWDIEYSGSIYLEKGEKYPIQLDYFEATGGANIVLQWTPPGYAKQVPPQGFLFPLHTQTIALHKGWNLISTYIHVQDSSIEQMFATLDVQMVKNEYGFWKKNQPAYFNSLKTIEPSQAYLLYMNNAGTLFLVGNVTQQTLQLPTTEGWKLLGIPFNTERAISDYFNSQNCHTIKNFDGFWQPNGTHNSLHNFEPGKGYFIKQ